MALRRDGKFTPSHENPLFSKIQNRTIFFLCTSLTEVFSIWIPLSWIYNNWPLWVSFLFLICILDQNCFIADFGVHCVFPWSYIPYYFFIIFLTYGYLMILYLFEVILCVFLEKSAFLLSHVSVLLNVWAENEVIWGLNLSISLFSS